LPRSDWTLEEVERIVADYFAMLEAELKGEVYSKADHNRRLQRELGRSKGSIEFKHQNITAVLSNFGEPGIAGYKPRQNYQSLLERAVKQWLDDYPTFFDNLEDGPVLSPKLEQEIPPAMSTASLIEEPPTMLGAPRSLGSATPRFSKTDYVRRDAENRRLGRLGEEWVLEFERRRLHDEEGRPDLAKRVRWTSEVLGDGAGYDIESFNRDASPRLIEVKTTGLGKYQPFLVTANEVRFSQRQPSAFELYRVFEYASRPRMYRLAGALTDTCTLDATLFRARVAPASA